jgi:hypothetical protein
MYSTLKEIWNSLEPKEKVYFKAGLQIICLIGLLAIVVLPLVLTMKAPFQFMDLSASGGIGDTINGIAGPFIALMASVLTFMAFYIQYQANIAQKEQFQKSLEKQKEASDAQEKIWRVERFENRFYELLKLHKSNVDEMYISDTIRGRDCFVNLFYELRYCYLLLERKLELYKKVENGIANFDGFDLMNLSYTVFTYGIGPYSEKNYKNFLNGEQSAVFNNTLKQFEEIQEDVLFEVNRLDPKFKFYKIEGYDIEEINFYHIPFRGHSNMLGHYFRHLFQTVNYITAQDFLSFEDKCQYVKTLRAQLSNFEQLLLYYNSIAWFRSEWREIFVKYKFIKNLPIPLADFDIKPQVFFDKEIDEYRKRGEYMFEWYEKPSEEN